MSELDIKKEDLVLDDTVKKNSKGEAILGQLYGPCADFLLPTRNGRGYSESLWEKVFDSEIINEYFEAGGILGELNHPADRSETDLEKVAVCMPEKPKKDKDGHLVAKFDILDTPNGRIVYTLAKYGYKLGVSSRGDGEVIEGLDGDTVDEDSYTLEAFDIVLLPAVKAARLKMVESVQKSFKEALTESLNKSTPEERRIMEDTLKGLKIDYKSEKADNIDVNQKANTANDVGVEVIKDLQESLAREKELRLEIKRLQEQLSVCDAKESKLKEKVQRYESSVISLSTNAKQVKTLKAEIENLKEQLIEKDNEIAVRDKRISKLVENRKLDKTSTQNLNESIQTKDTRISELSKQNRKLQESLDSIRKDSESKMSSLTEQIEDMKKNSYIKKNEYESKIKKANNLVEQYRATAKKAVDKYISFRAQTLGVNANEIKNRLGENYSFNDIDTVCESLQNYQINISKLPFDVNKGSVRVKVTESKKDPLKPKSVVDDEIDDQLLRLAGLDN